MDILMVTPELSPYARASRAGDTVAALGKALCQLEHRVTVAVPRYPGFEAGGLLAARRLTPLALPGGGTVTVLDGQLPTGATVVLFDAPGLFDRPGIYGEGGEYPDNPQRFGLLAQAALALAAQRAERGPAFDVVHLHDWPAAAAAACPGASVFPTIVTVHDGARRGVVTEDAARTFGVAVPPDTAAVSEGSGLSLLALGARAADAVTTVSPQIAADWVDAGRFGALSRALAGRPPAVGILSGLDYAVYNPATDPALRSRYDAEAPGNKGSSKTELLRRLGLDLEPARPLVVALVEEIADGEELLLRAVPDLLKNDVSLAVVGRSELGLARRLEGLVAEHPKTAAVDTATDDAGFRRACAAADFVILPSAYEQTAVWARAAQRYGALPVARATGAHVDTIVDCDAALSTGTGFLFDAPTEEALQGALARGLSAYVGPSFGTLRRRVMRLDLSWDRTARRYVQVYRQAIASRPRSA